MSYRFFRASIEKESINGAVYHLNRWLKSIHHEKTKTIKKFYINLRSAKRIIFLLVFQDSSGNRNITSKDLDEFLSISGKRIWLVYKEVDYPRFRIKDVLSVDIQRTISMFLGFILYEFQPSFNDEVIGFLSNDGVYANCKNVENVVLILRIMSIEIFLGKKRPKSALFRYLNYIFIDYEKFIINY